MVKVTPEGFCAVEVAGVPPVKLHDHDVGLFVETKTVTIASIATNVNAGAWTYVTFASPVSVTGPFYLGIEFAYASGDTVALTTNMDGQTTPGTGWEKWSDGTWHAYSDASSWGINIAHFISPVLCPIVTAEIEAMESEYLSVYPNPTDGQFTFVKEGRAKELDILIVDALGQKVFERHLESVDGKYNENFDLSSTSSGIYFMKIMSDGAETVKRIILSK